MVNLVYRHLATRPEVLEETWLALRPNLGSSAAAAAVRELAPGLGPDAETPAAATLDAYARANSLNLLGMRALLDGCPGSGLGGAPVDPPPPAAILPMVALDSLPPRIGELSVVLLGAEEPRIVPSLLRHFADDARLLDRLEPAVIVPRAEVVSERARRLAAGLPYPVTAVQDEATRAVAGRFTKAMARMLVAGELLRAAL